jgi:hypothetical protein
MFGKLSKKSIVDGKSITENLCTMWWMIMMKSTAARSSDQSHSGFVWKITAIMKL